MSNIIININGIHFEVSQETLGKFPPTITAKFDTAPNSHKRHRKVYFFERHPDVFKYILYYFQFGELHMPRSICPSLFRKELEYWGVEVSNLENCCLDVYGMAFENLRRLDDFEQDYQTKNDPVRLEPFARKWRRLQTHMWQILDNPFASRWSEAFYWTSIIFVFVSIFALTAATHPLFKTFSKLDGHRSMAGHFEWTVSASGSSASSVSDQTLGSSGLSGSSDTMFASGSSGPIGSSGTSGSSGPIGSSGMSGASGSSGSSGKGGSSGSSGHSGSSGTSGSSGISSSSETSGSSGTGGTGGMSKPSRLSENSGISGYETPLMENVGFLDGETVNKSIADMNSTTPVVMSSGSSATVHHKTFGIALLEFICFIFFTIEVLLKLIFCPRLRIFFSSILNVVDLVAIFPLYILLTLDLFLMSRDLVGKAEEIFEGVAVLRVFRLLRLARRIRGLRVLIYAIKSGLKDVLLLCLMLFMATIIFASLMYYVDSRRIFPSIPDGLWWAIVTLTTVGYGDMVPGTAPGKLLGSCCAITGLLIVAITVPIFVSKFLLYYNHVERKRWVVTPARKRFEDDL